MLGLLAKVLEGAGCEVLTADHGDLAVTTAEGEALDLILLDVLMPGEDGYAVCRRIKSIPRNASVPVIFLTGLWGEEEQARGRAAGGVDFIVKPFDAKALLTQVHRHLEHRVRDAVTGSDPRGDQVVIDIRVQGEPFDIFAEQEALWRGRPQVGALVTFLGLMRDINEGDQVAEMTLEHYPGMTEKALMAIAREAAERWLLTGIRIVHRVGRLRPQDPIVLVAVSSRHRGDAFRACELIIDYLKTRAPFWKKETTADGERWVETRAADDEAAGRWGG
jgi:molybdopterin synthase catalytic subunit